MCRAFSVKLYFSYLSVSSLRGFLDFSPCTFESYIHSLFPYRKQYWKCPRPFWNISILEPQVKPYFSQKKTPNKPNNRNYSKNFIFKKDRQGWIVSDLPLPSLQYLDKRIVGQKNSVCSWSKNMKIYETLFLKELAEES